MSLTDDLLELRETIHSIASELSESEWEENKKVFMAHIRMNHPEWSPEFVQSVLDDAKR